MRKIAIWFAIIAIVFLCLVGVLIGTGHASTTSKTNSLGAVIVMTDPNITLVASLLGGDVHEDRDGRQGYNLRLHPKYMYGLFDESVMFCGDVGKMLRDRLQDGVTTYQAYTYRRAASRLIDGIPCHTLLAIDNVENEKGIQ